MTLDDVLSEESTALLTQNKVRGHQVRDAQQQLRFRGLSDVYVPYHHTYASIPLSHEVAYRLIKLFGERTIDGDENPLFTFRRTAQCVDSYFHVVQFNAPRSVSSDIQRLRFSKRDDAFSLDTRRRSRQVFPSGYFDRQARWNLEEDQSLQPGTIVTIDPGLKRLLASKGELDKSYSTLRRHVRHATAGVETSKRNRVRGNLLSRLFKAGSQGEDAAGVRDQFSKSVYRDYVDETLARATLTLLAHEREVSQLSEGWGDLRHHQGKRQFELFLYDRPRLEAQRQLSIEEWMSLNHFFFDIETPKFIDGDYEICQVAATMMQHGSVVDKRVYSTVAVPFDEMKGHKILSGYATDADMVDDISDWAVQEGADIVLAFNSNFDISKMRERGDFRVGSADSTPKKEVTKSWFERFHVDGGFSIDLLRMAQTMVRGHPNVKLEMFSRVLRGSQGYHKSITYDEMHQLQLLSENKHIELDESTSSKLTAYVGSPVSNLSPDELASRAAEMIVSYVCDDTQELVDLYAGTPSVRAVMSHVAAMAQHFELDYCRLLYSPQMLKEVYLRGYFKHIGVQRDVIYPRGPRPLERQREQNKQALHDLVNETFRGGLSLNGREGSIQGLERRVIPLAVLLRQYVKLTDTVREFLEDTAKRMPDASPSESIALARYADGVLHFLFDGWGNYWRKSHLYDKFLEGMRMHILPGIERTPETMHVIGGVALDALADAGYFGDRPNIRYIQDNIRGFKNAQRLAEFLDAHLQPSIGDLRRDLYLTTGDLHALFWTMFASKKSSTRFAGHFRIDPHKLHAMLNEQVGLLAEQLDDAAVHVDYPYVYTVGKGDSIAHLPRQTTLDAAYVADGKVYSREEGFYKGVITKEYPAFHTNPLLGRRWRAALDAFFDADYDRGLREIWEGYREIQETDVRNLTDALREDFLFFNKSRDIFSGYHDDARHVRFYKRGDRSDPYHFALPDAGFEAEGEFEGVPYTTQIIRSRRQPVFIHGIEGFTPFLEEYMVRYRKKLTPFLLPAFRAAVDSYKPEMRDVLSGISRTFLRQNWRTPDTQMRLW